MTRQKRIRPAVGAPVAALAAVVTAVLPLTTLLRPPWTAPAFAAVVAVLAVGYLVRWIRPALALAAEAVVVAAVVALSFPGPLVGGLVAADSEWLLPEVVASASDAILNGVAPVVVHPPLAFVLISSIAVLTWVVDAIAIAARIPIVAALPLILVFITPQLAVPLGDHLSYAVAFALALLALVVLAGTRVRTRRIRAGTGAVAVALVVALAAVVIAPRIPVLPSADAGAFTTASGVDVSINLGDDLRNSSTEEVLRVRSDRGSAPYLRLATHTVFDDNGWHLDTGGTRPLDEGFDPIATSGLVGELEVAEERTWISDVALDIRYLPVPAGALEVSGAGSEWNAMVSNRTVRTTSASSEGASYRVTSARPVPTRAQFEASPWLADVDWERLMSETGTVVPEEISSVALDVPDAVREGSVGATARDVAGDAPTAYETALRLQEWLRSSEFTYSLSTPVQEGFDGSDTDAVERFLEVRAGYCVHFASTYALMARSLGLPTRIVVGYLPGNFGGERIDDLTVYSVSADRLHAWPEVYLLGIGWVPFDPTPSIAQAQSVTVDTPSGSTTPDQPRAPDEPDEETPEPTVSPTASATETDEPADRVASPTARSALWVALAILALILVFAIPALARVAVRARRLEAARAGDATAAWRELRAIAIDAELTLTTADTPRTVGRRLVEAGADIGDTDPLVSAIERALFARDADADGDLATHLRGVARSLRPDSLVGRIRRALLPRSLWGGASAPDPVMR